MRITAIKTVVVNAEMRNWIFVKVETSEAGLYGWGEATLEWKTRAVVGAIEDLAPIMIGRDPRDIQNAYRAMTKLGFWRMGVIGMTAISGIEQALWDILGKSLGTPVWRLLGGKTRDKLKVYTHLGLGDMRAVYETFEPQALANAAAKVVEAGYGALKVVFIPYTHYTSTPKAVAHVERLMRALRDAVGDDIDIMVDFHGRCGSVSTAVAFITALSPFGPLFAEEPIQPGDSQAMRDICDRTTVPIATGERLVGMQEFLPLLSARAANIIQPDLSHCGGLLEAKKIAALAEACFAGVAPHNPNGPVAGAVALHFGFATPNFVIQEVMAASVPWHDDVVQGPVQLVDGHWCLPEAPGLGIELNEREAAKHPFQQEVLASIHARIDDGTIVDW